MQVEFATSGSLSRQCKPTGLFFLSLICRLGGGGEFLPERLLKRGRAWQGTSRGGAGFLLPRDIEGPPKDRRRL